jgi:hypothetical protein
MVQALLIFAALAAAGLAAKAEPLYITQAQIDELLVAGGRSPDLAEQGGAFNQARRELLEHSLLARAWEGGGRRLDGTQLRGLSQDHLDVAMRVLQQRRLQVPPVSDDEVLDYAELARGRYHASHILVAERATADSLARRLEAGEAFAELARARSTDPGSAAAGGALGPVLAGDTVMEFEQTLFRLRPGEVSPPVQTPFGWHLIRLDSLIQRPGDWNDEDLRELRQRLEDYSRRSAEAELGRRLLADRGAVIHEAAVRRGAERDTVFASRDTVLLRGELTRMIGEVFGERASLLGPELGVEFLRFWVDRDAWRREVEALDFFRDEEVLDRMDVRERLLKSTLFVTGVLEPQLRWDEGDLFNYFINHEHEFLPQRAFGLFKLEFPGLDEAREARRQIHAEGLDPTAAAERWAPGSLPFELSAAEVRELGSETARALVELDPGRWSLPVEAPDAPRSRRWVLWQLIDRRMPRLEESAQLRVEVEERVHQALLNGAIARTVLEMQAITGWTDTEILE